MANGKGLRGGAWALSIVGILLLFATGNQYLQIRHKKINWEPMEGTVINYVVDPSEGGAAPILIYVWEQDSLSFTSSTYQSPPAYEINEQVPIFVNPNEPEMVFIDDLPSYMLTIVLGTLGVVLNLTGLGILFFSKKIG